MDKRENVSIAELIVLQFPTTLSFAMISGNHYQKNNHSLFIFLILCYIYWFTVLVFYSTTVSQFEINHSYLLKKVFYFLFFPILLIISNMVFIAMSLGFIQNILKLFELL